MEGDLGWPGHLTHPLRPASPLPAEEQMIKAHDTDWMAYGSCRDEATSLFFPSDGVGVEVAQRCAQPAR